jgi:oligopeptide transport system substrate-binding protein
LSWLTAGFILIGAAGCSRPEPTSTLAKEQVLRVSQRNEPADLDPARSTLPDEFFIIRALGEGLVTRAPGGGQRPGAAERWDVSPDGLTYTFHLRENAKWSNGEPVAAADFIASYQRLLTPATAAPKASLFFMVKNAQAFVAGQLADFNAVGLHAPDAHTVVITLERPTPDFLAYAASGPWIPVNPRIVARLGRDWTRPGNFVGNGPFVLTEWTPHQRIVVKRNPLYADNARVKLDEIDFLAFDNDDTEERAYRAGQVDVTMKLPVTKIATYKRENPADLHHAPLAEIRYLSFNTARAPFDDVRVRRALALAIDREKLVSRVLLGGQQPAARFLAPALRPRNDPDLSAGSAVRFDPEEARRLLAAAGFPQGTGFRSIEISAWSSSQTSVLEAIQQMWKKELGIDVTLAIREGNVHFSALRAGEYDVGFSTSIPDVADAADVLKDFFSQAPGNYPHWSDFRYDTLVNDAARTDDAAQRSGFLHDAEARLGELCPVAPLYFNARNWLMSPRVRGWQEDELWTRFYPSVYLQEN